MAQLRASYATQAVKAIVWKLLLVNMLQLMNGNGLSINNEEGKKFMVKTNMVGPDGRPVYWRLLQWREGEQYVDMIPPAILPKEGVLSGWSKGLGAELYSKRGVVPTLITGLWSGYDALGHSITSGDIPGEQQLADRAQFFWNTITPEPLDSGRRFDIANTILQVLTPIQISYGISTGATGITADEVKEFRRTLGEEEYRKDAVGRLTQLYPLDDWHWQIAIQENVLTLKQWIDLKKKEDWGAVDLEKRARTIKRKQEFFPVPWMRHD